MSKLCLVTGGAEDKIGKSSKAIGEYVNQVIKKYGIANTILIEVFCQRGKIVIKTDSGRLETDAEMKTFIIPLEHKRYK